MRFPPVVEAWLYRDPQDFADALITRSARAVTATSPGRSAPTVGVASHVAHDRYYTQARRLHVKQLMKGRR